MIILSQVVFSDVKSSSATVTSREVPFLRILDCRVGARRNVTLVQYPLKLSGRSVVPVARNNVHMLHRPFTFYRLSTHEMIAETEIVRQGSNVMIDCGL